MIPPSDDTRRLRQAEKLRAVADWFVDCKTLTLERLPEGLIAALRAGADALEAAAVTQAQTECCDVPIRSDERFCPKCGYEARTIP
jgi:hypothetical protein